MIDTPQNCRRITREFSQNRQD